MNKHKQDLSDLFALNNRSVALKSISTEKEVAGQAESVNGGRKTMYIHSLCNDPSQESSSLKEVGFLGRRRRRRRRSYKNTYLESEVRRSSLC